VFSSTPFSELIAQSMISLRVACAFIQSRYCAGRQFIAGAVDTTHHPWRWFGILKVADYIVSFQGDGSSFKCARFPVFSNLLRAYDLVDSRRDLVAEGESFW
jgi:hypothetical protein